MRVTVQLPDGRTIQGVHVAVHIPGVLGYAGYSKTVTTDLRGIAIFPDPGPTAFGRSADIMVARFHLGSKFYEYRGAALTSITGQFPKELTITLSAIDAPEELTAMQQATKLTLIVVLGATAIAVAATIRSLLTYKAGYL